MKQLITIAALFIVISAAHAQTNSPPAKKKDTTSKPVVNPKFVEDPKHVFDFHIVGTSAQIQGWYNVIITSNIDDSNISGHDIKESKISARMLLDSISAQAFRQHNADSVAFYAKPGKNKKNN